MLQLSSSLEENLAALNARFGASADFYAKRIELYHCSGAIVLFDNMASLEALWALLLDAATRHTPGLEPEQLAHSGAQVYELLMHHSGLPAEDSPVKEMEDLVRRLTAGMAVLLLDGCKKGIVFSVQGLKSRSVEEPSGEGNLRGSREGFADLLRVNLSLLRRLIRTDTLVMETAQADCAMKTEYAICYCRDRASRQAVARVRRTLQEAKPELLLDSSYFVPWLFPARCRLFAPVSYTERPASAAAKLCEGKIVVLVNGSPSALVLPSLFCENFDCLDDYATTALFSSFLRILKYGSFYLSIFLPGVFVCLAVYLPELIPPQLLYKIEAAEKATPLPLFAEMLLVILLLEIIREAGLRMPQTLGHSVSLVAALIIGDAAVGAGLMSTPVILVASITAISVFVTFAVRACHPAAAGCHAGGGSGRAGGAGVRGSGGSGGADVPLRDGGALPFERCLFRGWYHPPQLPGAVPPPIHHLEKEGVLNAAERGFLSPDAGPQHCGSRAGPRHPQGRAEQLRPRRPAGECAGNSGVGAPCGVRFLERRPPAPSGICR